ncbi:MAG: hypothetical protein KF689_06215 [Gemmatimonadaceae bacterium]|nr:hypothetical protein [Gemmatimonadaceae bacterium]MCW5825232.1 hypothetical protein [Gemmatimonadaceae bacterium]
MIGTLIALGVAWFGYATARRFVRERLRYVDAALTGGAAIVAGVAAMVLAWPVVWLLPFVGAPTAIAFGLSVGLGARAGASDVKDPYRLKG